MARATRSAFPPVIVAVPPEVSNRIRSRISAGIAWMARRAASSGENRADSPAAVRSPLRVRSRSASVREPRSARAVSAARDAVRYSSGVRSRSKASSSSP